jgi:outer membrane lipoprotein-sorting protein
MITTSYFIVKRLFRMAAVPPTKIIRLPCCAAANEVPRSMTRATLLLSFLLSTVGLHAAESLDFTPVKRWITRQDDFHAVTASFTQTRSLRALKSPLTSEGRLWFKAPSSFRWELGVPAKTIVLRKGDSIFLIQPGKKRVEKSSATAKPDKPSPMQAFGMMSFPFARDFGDFQRQFETLSISTEGTRCHLEVLPRDAQARKFLSALKLDFNTANGHLLGFEMVTREGSALRNEFANVQVNPKIPADVFEFDFTGYEVVDAKN